MSEEAHVTATSATKAQNAMVCGVRVKRVAIKAEQHKLPGRNAYSSHCVIEVDEILAFLPLLPACSRMQHCLPIHGRDGKMCRIVVYCCSCSLLCHPYDKQ